MMELLQLASDDQLALAICAGAFVLSGLVMYFSHHVGKLTGHVRLHDESPSVEIERPVIHHSEASRNKAA